MNIQSKCKLLIQFILTKCKLIHGLAILLWNEIACKIQYTKIN